MQSYALHPHVLGYAYGQIKQSSVLTFLS